MNVLTVAVLLIAFLVFAVAANGAINPPVFLPPQDAMEAAIHMVRRVIVEMGWNVAQWDPILMGITFACCADPADVLHYARVILFRIIRDMARSNNSSVTPLWNCALSVLDKQHNPVIMLIEG